VGSPILKANCSLHWIILVGLRIVVGFAWYVSDMTASSRARSGYQSSTAFAYHLSH
jgi:hypothetical protein